MSDVALRQGKRGNRELPLTGEPKHLPARHQDLQVLGRLEQLRHDRRRLDEMLEVVQHQEHPAPSQEVLQHVDGSATRGLGCAERLGDGRHDHRRARHGTQHHDGDTVLEARLQIHGGPERDAGLADPAGTGERDQPNVVALDELTDDAHLVLASDEAARRGGHVGALDRAERCVLEAFGQEQGQILFDQPLELGGRPERLVGRLPLTLDPIQKVR